MLARPTAPSSLTPSTGLPCLACCMNAAARPRFRTPLCCMRDPVCLHSRLALGLQDATDPTAPASMQASRLRRSFPPPPKPTKSTPDVDRRPFRRTTINGGKRNRLEGRSSPKRVRDGMEWKAGLRLRRTMWSPPPRATGAFAEISRPCAARVCWTVEQFSLFLSLSLSLSLSDTSR
jgi:hypothetical protein